MLLLLLAAPGPRAGSLEEDLGRSEVRVRSAPYPLVAGRTVGRIALLERLERLDYERVHEQPAQAGQFFYGHDVFWIFRRRYRWAGKQRQETLVGLELRKPDGMIVGGRDAAGRVVPLRGEFALEPETLAETLSGRRADRIRVRLDDLPDVVWQTLLAAEDARFFDHVGVDARAVARAALANLKRGKLAQGGSTITQQLVKNRDLTPKRSFGRKASEAVRALLLEAEYDKREILEAYLNRTYYGHVDGLAVHGLGAAARIFFSKPAERLSLAEAALLAAIVQGPNRLSPLEHPERALERRNWVLSRLGDLGWVGARALSDARSAPLGIEPSAPVSSTPVHFLSWIAHVVQREAPKRVESRRGFVVETTLDPWLQRLAERAVGTGLERLRRDHRRLRGVGLSAGLVALDAGSGEVLAYVGGDPAEAHGGFDRARSARRQPGSTVKPLVLLEALDDCGDRDPLHAATRVADEPLTLDLPSGPWSPRNHDGRFRGVVDVRRALAESLNVPLVRIARWCGLSETARTLERAGLPLPGQPPPSFVLGSVEATPLELAGAYTVLATPGKALTPLPVRRIEKPEGRALARMRPESRRVVRPASAYLVREMLGSAVARGTARAADIEGLDVAAKTGSTTDLRDAWLAGHAGSVVAVVWVGRDDDGPLGLSGAAAAGPLWRTFMERAVRARPPRPLEAPRLIVERYIDPETGLLVRKANRRARKELFRSDVLPPRDRFWRVDRPVPVIR